MEPRLRPIEKPAGLLMKIAYWISRKKYGKVISPLKVVYARMPASFALWANKIPQLQKQLQLPADLVLLIRIHVAQLNTCEFCIDIGKSYAIKQFPQQEKFLEVATYAYSPMFSEKEKVVLAFAEEITRHKKVSDATFTQTRKFCSEQELVEIGWVVATEHLYNFTNIAFEVESDGLCILPSSVKQQSVPALS